ncbi:MAG: hypothetical protein Kow00124_30900 [Anaerolineae bacterium]
MSVRLKVPYKSQVGPEAGYSHNDCGPACVAMMLAAAGTDVTIDSMYTAGPAAGLLSGGLISVPTLVQLAAAYGLTLKVHNKGSGMTPEGLRQMIDQGRPALLLIDYKPIVNAGLNTITTSGNFGHFAVAVGYDGDDFFIHDPYHRQEEGGFFRWSETVLESCWNHGYGSSGNYYQRTCLAPPHAIAEKEQPPFVIPEEHDRRLKAKAIFEGTAPPVITDETQYHAALTWLGDWGSEQGEWKLKEGETLASVSAHLYGDEDLWTGLLAFNGMTSAAEAAPGVVIRYPILPGMPGEHKPHYATPRMEFSFTNQDVINAFYQVYKSISQSDPDKYWEVIVACDIEEVAQDRRARYTGPDIRTLECIPADIREKIAARLGLS